MKTRFVMLMIFLGQILFGQSFTIKIEKNDFFYRNAENPVSFIRNPADSLGPMSVTVNEGRIKPNGEGNFIIIPKPDSKNIILTAAAKDNHGKVKSGRFEVEVKDTPQPMTFVNQQTELKIDKSELENLRFEALIPDFDYRLSFEITDFELIIPKKKPIRNQGNKFSPEVLKELNKLKSGRQIIIRNIRIVAVEGYYSEDKNFESANQIVIELK
jgi:hypothetical protein